VTNRERCICGKVFLLSACPFVAGLKTISKNVTRISCEEEYHVTVVVVVVFDTYYFFVCGWTSCASLVTFNSQQQGVLDASYLLNVQFFFTKFNMMQLQTNKGTTRIY
jgi:hypothetical protein